MSEETKSVSRSCQLDSDSPEFYNILIGIAIAWIIQFIAVRGFGLDYISSFFLLFLISSIFASIISFIIHIRCKNKVLNFLIKILIAIGGSLIGTLLRV
jgi:hypothetical protein